MKKPFLLFFLFLSIFYLYGCSGYIPKAGQVSIKSNAFYPAEPIGRFILRVNRSLEEEDAKQLALMITRESRIQGIDPRIVASVIAVESRFNTRAVSSTGAKGLGQLKDGTATYLGVKDPFDPFQNIKGTARYLGELSDRWENRSNATELTLASYNIGPGEVKRRLEAGAPLPDHTKTYIDRVMTYFEQIQ